MACTQEKKSIKDEICYHVPLTTTTQKQAKPTYVGLHCVDLNVHIGCEQAGY